MWRFIISVIIFIGGAQGILVVGPKFIRANRDYTVVISNFNSTMNKVNLILRLEGHTDNGTSALNIMKSVDVRRHMNRMITFNMPVDLSAGNYKITIDGQSGFSFHEEVELVYRSKTLSGFIQLDKPVYKPGDTVKFRVIVLNCELKPPILVKTVRVTIYDALNNLIRELSSAKLSAGVFESDLQIAPTPMLGTWKISVHVDERKLASKTFEVKEYVLSLFDVEVKPSTIPLMNHNELALTIAANYHFGKPVKGLVNVELYLQEKRLDQKKEINIDGVGQVKLKFNDELNAINDQADVLVKTTFVEQHTNRTVMKESLITVHEHMYGVELIKESPQFRPGLAFNCKLQFRYHDGTPARGITGEVEVTDIEYKRTATSDDKGLIKLELYPSDTTEKMTVIFSNGLDFEEEVHKVDSGTNAYLKLVLKYPSHSRIQVKSLLSFMVTCSENMAFFLYYVMSKGNIIDSGFERLNKKKQHLLKLNATEQMIPKAKIIVATIASNTVVYDVMTLDFKTLRNDFSLRIDAQEVKPGRQIELQMSGRPGAYVGLAAYDKGLLYYNKYHDLFWEDVMNEFDEFHKIDYNEYDKFHSFGLFARTLAGIEFEGATDKSARVRGQTNEPIERLVSYRTNFAESWLWQNVTIGWSGTRKLIEVVPDTTTSWYLTGFSIDPEYGLGIIKKPIQFTTIQPFYIVESLPYSIKRGERVVLQFTLFNNLGVEYAADVTLYNVANQTEFIEESSNDLSYTKSVSVPPKVGVPVSFPVKARKLGEMAVRVKASIMLGSEWDALEKVIRVMPESLVQEKMESRFFWLNTYNTQSFPISLDIDKKADDGSKNIEFRVTPNLLTTVIDNLDDLLAVPTGSGEQNMVNFVPNIVVLDYLVAVGSKEKSLLDKATNLLRQGYQNQMRYRQMDGSFAVWQNASGSVFLTAFVAKSMQTASKYINEINEAMVEEAYDWLASKQHRSGRFDEVGSVIHQDMQGGLRNGIALTSYVLTALLENENAKLKHADVIQNAMSYLSRQMETTNNAYDLSIATYALMLNRHSMKDKAFKRLLEKSTATNDGSERYWTGEASDIETTAYALLSFVLAEKYLDGIPVMRWLVNQRYVTGSFPRTQDTFVGLKALTKLAEKISPSRNDYKITLIHNRNLKHFRINGEERRSLNYIVPEDVKMLNVSVSGIGFGLLEVIYRYSISFENFVHRFNLDLKKQTTGSDYELRLKVCASFNPTISNTLSNMAMLEVNFPSGFVVDRNPISEQTIVNPIQLVQVRYGATSVVVYYDNMGRERNCFTVTAYRRFKVELKRPAYVVVYDSVNPKWTGIASYEVD